jgi:hypothetical protein
MAVTPYIPGLEVTIKVNNTPLQEFIDDDPDEILGDYANTLRTKTVSKFVESKTGEEFTVGISISPKYQWTSPAISIRVEADGQRVTSRAFDLQDVQSMGEGAAYETTVKGHRSYDAERGSGQLHYMKFAELNTSKSFQART